MRNLLQIIFVVQILFVSCNKERENNGESVNQKILEKSSIKKSEKINDTTMELINGPTKSLRIRNYAQMILDGKIQPSDNDATFEVIDQLFVDNQNDLDFYFEVFRVIVDKSDGALSEVVGQYIMSFFKLYPDYFISKYSDFESSEKMKYVYQMSFEFYYSEDNYKTEINSFFDKLTNRLISKSQFQTEILEEMRRIVIKETERILVE